MASRRKKIYRKPRFKKPFSRRDREGVPLAPDFFLRKKEKASGDCSSSQAVS